MEAGVHWWQQDWVWAAFGSVAVPLSILFYLREERQKFYAQIDEMYRRILEMVVESPELRRPPPNGQDDGKYDAFAFIVWNFLETIYDYCSGNERLMRTWRPILRTESKIHGEWFKRAENQGNFKDEFRDYVEGRKWEASATARAKLVRFFR